MKRNCIHQIRHQPSQTPRVQPRQARYRCTTTACSYLLQLSSCPAGYYLFRVSPDICPRRTALAASDITSIDGDLSTGNILELNYGSVDFPVSSQQFLTNTVLYSFRDCVNELVGHTCKFEG